MTDISPEQLLDGLKTIALDAGQAILKIYQGAQIEVASKVDDSPVTAADLAAEKVILAGLARLAPEIQVISEEAVAGGTKPQRHDRFFLVDPLDGTKEFIARNGEFTVNVALIEHGKAVAGVVYAPAKGTLYLGGKSRAFAANADPGSVLGQGARAGTSALRAIGARKPPASGAVAVASRSHRDPETDKFLAAHKVSDVVSAGSSLKFCLVAEGRADVYPRHGTTMEWDTAAGQAVLEAAGGSVREVSGAPFLYGKFDKGLKNPHFIARGRE